MLGLRWRLTRQAGVRLSAIFSTMTVPFADALRRMIRVVHRVAWLAGRPEPLGGLAMSSSADRDGHPCAY